MKKIIDAYDLVQFVDSVGLSEWLKEFYSKGRAEALAEVNAILDEHINNDTIEWDTWLKKRPALTKLKEEIKNKLE